MPRKIEKFPPCLSKALREGELIGMRNQHEIEKKTTDEMRERIVQLEAEVMGLEGCCQVLEKAFGVPKKATLKQIDERIGYFVKLEKERDEWRDSFKTAQDELYKLKKELKENKVYSCGNCERLQKENTAMRKQIVDSCIRRS